MEALQGLCAGAAVSYLTHRGQKDNTWINVALQVNHLLLLMGVVVAEAGLPTDKMDLVQRCALVLLPVAACAPLSGKKCPSGAAFNRLYQVASAVSAVVLFILGRKDFGAGVLVMLFLDYLSKNRTIQRLMMPLAALAAFGFAARVMQDEIITSPITLVVAGVSACVSRFQPGRASVNREYFYRPIRYYFPKPIGKISTHKERFSSLQVRNVATLFSPGWPSSKSRAG